MFLLPHLKIIGLFIFSQIIPFFLLKSVFTDQLNFGADFSKLLFELNICHFSI
jgi:hypothetical protein